MLQVLKAQNEATGKPASITFRCNMPHVLLWLISEFTELDLRNILLHMNGSSFHMHRWCASWTYQIDIYTHTHTEIHAYVVGICLKCTVLINSHRYQFYSEQIHQDKYWTIFKIPFCPPFLLPLRLVRLIGLYFLNHNFWID